MDICIFKSFELLLPNKNKVFFLFDFVDTVHAVQRRRMADGKMANNSNTSFEKLKGSENYQTWAFAMENYLILHSLAACIDELMPETSAAKIQEAKARMVLSIDQSIYVHIRSEKTALEIWNKLKLMYEDKGLTRKIGLLRTLVTTNLENCDSMDDYISKIVSTSQKLIGIGFELTEEWIGCFLLAGLTDEFMPIIIDNGHRKFGNENHWRYDKIEII